MPSKLALILDDNEGILLQLKTLLKRKGFQVHSFSDGKEAVKYFHEIKQKLDLVVTDMELPSFSGLEFLTIIRKEREDLPIICVSGSWVYNESLKEKAEKLNPSALLPKPILRTSFLKALDKIFEKK